MSGKPGLARRMSYIEPFEEIAAKALIDNLFRELTGKPFGFRPGGYQIAVKIFIRPEELKEITRDDGSKVTLYRPLSMTEGDRFQSVAALVCAVGPQAFTGENAKGNDRFPEGPWCKVGDWVVIPRYESFQMTYRGVALAVLADDKIVGVIEDPMDVSADYAQGQV